MKKKLDWKLFGWCSFVSIFFNISMTRGCDTFGWSVVIMILTFVIFFVPFLPNDWLKRVVDVEVDYNE